MVNRLSIIQNFKIKLIKNSVNPDEFIWIIQNFTTKQIITSFLKKNNIPYLSKMGYLIFSKIYFDLIDKINYLINTNLKFNNIEIKTIETLYNFLIDLDWSIKPQTEYQYNLIILTNEKIKKYIFNKNLITEINYFYNKNKDQFIELNKAKEKLTISFKDSYNRLIEEFDISIEYDSSISKIFNIYNYEKVKIAKVIKDRVVNSVISHYLEGFSIDFNDYEIGLVQYSNDSEEFCIQLSNIKSGKNIIIYPIVFDLHTGIISEAGKGMGQLRLI